MRVNPVSKEVADAGSVGEPFKPGDYDFVVQAAEETVSKSGNEMLKLTLHVFDRSGEKRTVFDYILSSESGAWKARHMMETIGMIRQYERGIIDPHEIIGKPGRCKLRFVPATGDYPAKNAVADYLGPVTTAPTPTPRQKAMASASAGDINDEIPFLT